MITPSTLKNPLGFIKTFITEESFKLHRKWFFAGWEQAKLENDPDIIVDRSRKFIIQYYDDDGLGRKITYNAEIRKLLDREVHTSIKFIREGIADFPYEG